MKLSLALVVLALAAVCLAQEDCDGCCCPAGCCGHGANPTWICCPKGFHCAVNQETCEEIENLADLPAVAASSSPDTVSALTAFPFAARNQCDETQLTCEAGCCAYPNWVCCEDDKNCAAEAHHCPPVKSAQRIARLIRAGKAAELVQGELRCPDPDIEDCTMPKF